MEWIAKDRSNKYKKNYITNKKRELKYRVLDILEEDSIGRVEYSGVHNQSKVPYILKTTYFNKGTIPEVKHRKTASWEFR